MTERDEDQRPSIKVTDRRRFRDAATAPADAGAAPTAGEGEEGHVAEGADAGSDLERAQREAAEYLDHLRRLQAEFDNFRKRTLKEQTTAVELASQPVVSRLLEVVDDFELALMAAEQQPDFERFRKGVELVYAKLIDALHAEGVQRIEAEGRPFDPQLHEALMQTGEGDGDLLVGDVLRPGYILKGRVLRPAGVRVHRDATDPSE